jgi:hypothetical protein
LVKKLSSNKSPQAAWAIANIPKWGRRLFGDTHWDGIFNLKKGSVSRKTLDEYLQSA